MRFENIHHREKDARKHVFLLVALSYILIEILPFSYNAFSLHFMLLSFRSLYVTTRLLLLVHSNFQCDLRHIPFSMHHALHYCNPGGVGLGRSEPARMRGTPPVSLHLGRGRQPTAARLVQHFHDRIH